MDKVDEKVAKLDLDDAEELVLKMQDLARSLDHSTVPAELDLQTFLRKHRNEMTALFRKIDAKWEKSPLQWLQAKHLLVNAQWSLIVARALNWQGWMSVPAADYLENTTETPAMRQKELQILLRKDYPQISKELVKWLRTKEMRELDFMSAKYQQEALGFCVKNNL